ncbi:hypothetical protein ABTY98_24020 [Streptomyces sp. NPDC096040]|uniref:hypothetical protein n=1 Tax=Streptomyces sp. NPDC096040 TaxID=3155541 RepID=UPI00331FD52F
MSDRRSEQSSGDEPSSSSSMPDEVWEQFIRDTERDIRKSAPKEPSARAREVTERLKGQQEPEGWRTGPAWQEMNGRAARRRKIWTVVGLPLAVAVAVVAMRPSLIPGDPFGSSSGASSGTDTATSPLPAETAAPTAPPSAVAADTPTLDHPFAGSPALRWADGAAGIVLPKATALGSIPKDRVELALHQTKKLLVDANLDPEVVAGAHPDAALAVLDPRQPGLLDELNTALHTPSKTHDPLSLFSRFDPEDVHLAGQVVKTRGRITFAKGKYEGVAVHADFTFVYPVVRADGSDEVTRTIVRRIIDTELSDPAHYRVTPGRLTLLGYDEDAGNSACDIDDGYLHPQFPSQAPTGSAAPTGPSIDPYDRSRKLGNEPEGCGTVSRT